MSFWSIGILFTMGVAWPHFSSDKYTPFDKLVFVVLILVGWPLLLGMEIDTHLFRPTLTVQPAPDPLTKETPPEVFGHFWELLDVAPKDQTIVVWCPPAHGLSAMMSACKWHPDAGFTVDELREPTLWLCKLEDSMWVKPQI